MAVNTLPNAQEPYIHSNIINFRVAHRQQLLNANGNNRLQETLDTIAQVREELKTEAETFLDGKDPQQFMKEYYFGGGENNEETIEQLFFQAFNDLFGTQLVYGRLSQVIGYKLSEIADLIGVKIDNNIDRIVSTSEAIEYINEKIKKHFTTYGKTKTRKKVKNTLSFGTEDFKKIFVPGKAYTTTQKEIKELLRNFGSANGEMVAQETYKILKTEECKNYIKQRVGHKFINQNFDTYYENYIKTLILTLSKKLQSRTITNKQALSGAMGEEFFISILSTSSGMNFEVTGSWTEDETRKKMIDANQNNKKISKPNLSNNKEWKELNKQSYSDIILTNSKGMNVRVQSKYFQGLVNKVNEGTENLNQSIHLFKEDLTIDQFIKKMQDQGQVFSSFDPNGLGYAIANGIWFAHAGSIDYNGKLEKGKEMTFDYRDIFTELGQGAGNFLGVIIDKNVKPIMEFSNVFFLINNRILLPTWVILDNLYNLLSTTEKNDKIGYLSMNKGIVSGVKFNAKQLRSKKEEAVGSFNKRTYEDENLLRVGREKGREIIDRIKMPNINLNINLKEALTSSYKLL